MIRLRGAAARAFVDGIQKSLTRRCRFCGCTEMQACPGGCSWAGETLCSACAPPVAETITALCLVSGTDHITIDQVRTWTVDQRADAFAWAMAVHYHAGDNPDVVVPPRPAFTLAQQVPSVRHVLREEIASRKVGHPVYFMKMVPIGPMCTSELAMAETFDSAAAAKQSPAYLHVFSSFVAEPLPASPATEVRS